MGFELVDVEPGDPRLETDLLPVLRQLRPHLDAPTYAAVYERGHRQGLRFLAAYDRGRCVGVAGWRLLHSTHTLTKLYVDDLVTAQDARSGGVGHALLAELADRGRAAGCTVLDLDSGVQRHDAHRFYFRERMHISGHHFQREL